MHAPVRFAAASRETLREIFAPYTRPPMPTGRPRTQAPRRVSLSHPPPAPPSSSQLRAQLLAHCRALHLFEPACPGSAFLPDMLSTRASQQSSSFTSMISPATGAHDVGASAFKRSRFARPSRSPASFFVDKARLNL